jgi:hypothetical protein
MPPDEPLIAGRPPPFGDWMMLRARYLSLILAGIDPTYVYALSDQEAAALIRESIRRLESLRRELRGPAGTAGPIPQEPDPDEV